jgi:hypothetical protein
MKSHVAWIAVGVLSFSAFALYGDEKAPTTKKEGEGAPASVWMKHKLEFSQHILAGIATADFDQIIKNAESMRGLSKVEGFVRARTPGYKIYLHQFEQANDEIIKQGYKKNVDGAALAFTQMTISCISCHRHLRDEQNK